MLYSPRFISYCLFSLNHYSANKCSLINWSKCVGNCNAPVDHLDARLIISHSLKCFCMEKCNSNPIEMQYAKYNLHYFASDMNKHFENNLKKNVHSCSVLSQYCQSTEYWFDLSTDWRGYTNTLCITISRWTAHIKLSLTNCYCCCDLVFVIETQLQFEWWVF